MVLALQNLGGVYDVGCCCCFSSLEVFHFIGFRHHLSPPPPAAFYELSSSFYTYSILSTQLITEWFVTLSFYLFCAFHFYHECYGFEQIFFYRSRFLPYTPSLVTQMRTGTPHPESISVPALIELFLLADAWPWTTDVWIIRPLVSQLHQWAKK